MDTPNDDAPLEPRFPTLEDFLDLCRRLNEAEARYIIIGGWAVIYHGFNRTTEHIDLLIDCSPENFTRIKSAMAGLPDGAIRDVTQKDLDEYLVVRIGDEFVIDLMKSACGITYEEAAGEIQSATVKGVTVPFASPKLLLRLKQTYREKDALDRMFLTRLVAGEEESDS